MRRANDENKFSLALKRHNRYTQKDKGRGMAIEILDKVDGADHRVLSVHSRAGDGLEVGTWRTVRVGRSGCSDVGVDDPTCPGLVFQVTAQDDDWEVAIPKRVELEVLIELDHPSAEASRLTRDSYFTAESATVSFVTDRAEYLFDITWVGSPLTPVNRRAVDVQAERVAGDTIREPYRLSLERSVDRAIIAACSDRVRKVGAPALSSRRLAELLHVRTKDPVEAVKRRIIRAVQELCYEKHSKFPNELPSGVRFGRNEAVEFLVRTGQVDTALVDLAVAAETAHWKTTGGEHDQP